MIAYPDCSFLCAVYRLQDNSVPATTYFQRLPEPLSVTSLLLYEFRQSVRFQNFLFASDRTRGFGKSEGVKMLADLQSDLAAGIVEIVSADWPGVHALAERLSAQHTTIAGNRSFDILHVATALHFGAREFLTFNERQAALARAEGLRVSLA
jgi:predicted nucleic acid-binding protein